jgi:hypothetical protein
MNSAENCAETFAALAGAFQFAYVARDAERAARAFVAHYATPEFRIHDVTVDCGGQPDTCSLRVAIAWIGSKQIEIIQPVAGAIDLYLPSLPDDPDATAFHHVGIRVPGTLQDWEQRRLTLLARGERFALEGGFAQTMRFGYLDTADRLGHYVEYIWLGAPFLSEKAAAP